MNTLKYILITIVGVLLFTSCEEDKFTSNIESGTNLATFSNSNSGKAVANISDGTEYPVEVRMQLTGPSVRDVSGDVTLNIEPGFEGIPDSVKAEQGTHFEINSNQITLTESNDYIGNYQFTMLTQGVTAPLTHSDGSARKPQFKLNVTSATGAENVVNSGKPITVTLSYACPSNMQGMYDVQVPGEGTVNGVTVESSGVGEYTSGIFAEFGGPSTANINGFPRGVIFNDTCGEVSVPEQTLGQFPNVVEGTATTQVNGDAQVVGGVNSFDLTYSIEGYGTRTTTYTYVGPLP